MRKARAAKSVSVFMCLLKSAGRALWILVDKHPHRYENMLHITRSVFFSVYWKRGVLFSELYRVCKMYCKHKRHTAAKYTSSGKAPWKKYDTIRAEPINSAHAQQNNNKNILRPPMCNVMCSAHGLSEWFFSLAMVSFGTLTAAFDYINIL